VKYFSWNEEKDKLLKARRGVSFEEVVFHIQEGAVLDILEHPNKVWYRGQRILVGAINGYAYLVPGVETAREIFLKTVVPSRKATRKHLRGGPNA
jgi:uncharacterized DUF497 family protein